MNIYMFSDSFASIYIFIPILICVARIIDVSLGTLRIIFVSKGFKVLAPILGFFEILIWLIAITHVMANLTNWVNYIAYAVGFALGNFIGISIENQLSLGMVVLRIITKSDASKLIEVLRERGFGVTVVEAAGSSGPVHLVFMVVNRSSLASIVPYIKEFNPRAFYTVSDLRYVTEGVFPAKVSLFSKFTALTGARKAK